MGVEKASQWGTLKNTDSIKYTPYPSFPSFLPSPFLTCYVIIPASFGGKGPHLRQCLVTQPSSAVLLQQSRQLTPSSRHSYRISPTSIQFLFECTCTSEPAPNTNHITCRYLELAYQFTLSSKDSPGISSNPLSPHSSTCSCDVVCIMYWTSFNHVLTSLLSSLLGCIPRNIRFTILIHSFQMFTNV